MSVVELGEAVRCEGEGGGGVVCGQHEVEGDGGVEGGWGGPGGVAGEASV